MISNNADTDTKIKIINSNDVIKYVIVMLMVYCFPLKFLEAAQYDLEIQIENSLTEFTLPGSTGLLTLTILNRGPDVTPLQFDVDNSLLIISDELPAEFHAELPLSFTDQAPNCILSWEAIDHKWIISMPFIILPAGETRVCQLSYVVNNINYENVNHLDLTWTVLPESGFSEPDTNPLNDSAFTRFIFAIKPTQVTMLSGRLIFVLSILLMIVGCIYFKCRGIKVNRGF